MEADHFDKILEERRANAERTIAPITREELVALGEQLFNQPDHPWQEHYVRFVEEGDRFFGGNAGGELHFVYSPSKRAGLWYRLEGLRGLGPIQERGLAVLEKLTAGK